MLWELDPSGQHDWPVMSRIWTSDFESNSQDTALEREFPTDRFLERDFWPANKAQPDWLHLQ
jgi:hypothetical protein